MTGDGDLVELVQAARRRGAVYADARYVEREHESVNVKDGQVEGIERLRDRGVGLRVLAGGAWGFAASDRLDETGLRALVAEALARAEASASVQRRRVVLAPQAPERGEYRTPLERDPFAVPIAERVALLLEANAALRGPNAATRRSGVAAYRTRKHLVTSEGTDVQQEIVETSATLSVLAVKAGAKPALRQDMRNARQGGWEFVESLELPDRKSVV